MYFEILYYFGIHSAITLIVLSNFVVPCHLCDGVTPRMLLPAFFSILHGLAM